MTTATIRPDDFPAHYHPATYPAWLMGQLWAQGIRFLPGLKALAFSAEDVQAHIAPPWRIERNPEGVITVWQGDPTPDHPPVPAP